MDISKLEPKDLCIKYIHPDSQNPCFIEGNEGVADMVEVAKMAVPAGVPYEILPKSSVPELTQAYVEFFSDSMLGQKIMATPLFEKRVAKLLVKWGVLAKNPTQIPVEKL